MKAHDIMHADLVSLQPDDSVFKAAKTMLERKISAILVMDGGNLVGILTEADLMRRFELNTDQQRSRLREFFTGPGKLSHDYVRAAGRKIHEVMTSDVKTVADSAELRDVVETMEKNHIKHVPVMTGHAVIGMISRSDIMRALVASMPEQPARPMTDEEIRRVLVAHLEKQNWAPADLVSVSVKDGVLTLSGAVMDPRQMEAFEVAAENIPGVKKINDQLIYVDPLSGSSYDANNNLLEPGRFL
jgi:Predicted signal-transduction protein containing cAMP-binding and CBS domains